MTTILGISISHDGTLSVVRDGAHVFSIAEERLSRQKGHIGFPFRALEYVFAQGIADPSTVATVGIAIDQFRKSSNRTLEFELADDVPYYDIMNSPPPEGFAFRQRRFDRSQSPEEVRETVRARVAEILAGHGCAAPIEFVDHHLCHAASVTYATALPDPVVITLDGEGDGLSGTVSVLDRDRLQRLTSVPDDLSVGNVYSHVTRQLGYKVSRHEGKITGLAAFGDPERGTGLLRDAMAVKDGAFGMAASLGDRLSMTLSDSLTQGRVAFFRARPRKVAARIAHLSAEDQAAAVQTWLEEVTCDFVRHWVGATGKRNVALAGGVFANVKLNQRIADLPGVEAVFVCPNMGDGGNALGAAWVAHERFTGLPPARTEMPHAYWGPAPTRGEIDMALAASPLKLSVVEPEDLPATVALAIHDGQIVGWFQGAMEYGPRALGHRSIVARPTERHLNEKLNRRLSRTEFMPFAPSCLIEARDEVFVIDKPGTVHTAEFMTITYDVRPEWSERIGAVVHVDNTARPQFVDAAHNPDYHAMIAAYRDLSGLPLVVNTSFNVHEEPIVCVPAEGLRALEDGVIDALAIGPYYVTAQ
ncbi:MAG: carbamoyltransferase C-terminal domain-containing protein [Pseudomonadota bacterium]